MPSFNTSRYSREQSAEISVSALAVLENSSVALTIPEIQQADLSLVNSTPQKLARELSKLCEAGFVRKAQSKSKGRMVYMAISKMLEQGLEI